MSTEISRTRSITLKVAFQALIIVILSSLLGISSNLIRRDQISFISHSSDFVKERKTGDSMSLEQAKERFDNGTGFFIDARSDEDYSKGHILNALNLPEEDLDRRIDEVRGLIPEDSEITVIVYCDGEECDSSNRLAERLKTYGYTNVRVFFGGWNEWVRAGYPIEG
jgi:rhodanese-related sulfurtransferase